jgi:hypothetical protein
MPDPRPGTEVLFNGDVRRVTVGPTIVEGEWAVKLAGMMDAWGRWSEWGMENR